MKKLANNVRQLLIDEGKNSSLASNIDSESKRIPFIHSFPKNSCEISSFLFAKLAKDTSPTSEVMIVEGRCCNEKHFWVLIDKLIYDITIDQFPNFHEPILGLKSDSLNILKPVCSENINTAFSSWDQSHKGDWINFLKSKLGE